jgi:hypothetical protein
MQTETGDFSDNLEIFLTAVYNLKHGDANDGFQMINDLRNRIVSTGELKSNTWLLPKLDFYLCTAPRDGAGNVKRRRTSAFTLKEKLWRLASEVWRLARDVTGKR